jgi:hypothetical protein
MYAQDTQLGAWRKDMFVSSCMHVRMFVGMYSKETQLGAWRENILVKQNTHIHSCMYACMYVYVGKQGKIKTCLHTHTHTFTAGSGSKRAQIIAVPARQVGIQGPGRQAASG